MPHRKGAPPEAGGSERIEEPHEDTLPRSAVATAVTVADVARLDRRVAQLAGRPA